MKVLKLFIGFVLTLCLQECETLSNIDKCKHQLNISHYQECPHGVLVPFWGKKSDPLLTRIYRSSILFIIMIYFFVGISIVSDKFMESIEVITSREKSVEVKDKNGQYQTVKLQIWNKTIANLTLMALGSSAPEILLAIIELIGHEFEFKDLGPSTIVGSAAFNLCLITAVCVTVVPNGTTKRIDNFMVFLVTSTASVLAYVWLYVIISVTSQGVVELWEALLTFLYFPTLALIAYFAESKFSLCRGQISKVHLANGDKTQSLTMRQESENDYDKPIQIIQNIRKEYPDATHERQIELAKQQLAKLGDRKCKSHAYYLMLAVRQIMLGNIPAKRSSEFNSIISFQSENTAVKQTVGFDSDLYHVAENAGKVYVRVSRNGGSMATPILVHCATVSGTAKEHKSYIPIDGDFIMKEYTEIVTFPIVIVDDDVYEDDESFQLVLSDIRIITDKSTISTVPAPREKFQLGNKTATVTILDDDHPGIFNLTQSFLTISEDKKHIEISVQRDKGCRGCILLPYRTIAGTAKELENFIPDKGILRFSNDEFIKTFRISLINTESFELDIYFFVQLGKPIVESKIPEGNNTDNMSFDTFNEDPNPSADTNEKAVNKDQPALGLTRVVKVSIGESQSLKEAIQDMILSEAPNIINKHGWRDQFIAAFTVLPSDNDDDDDDTEGTGVSVKEKSVTCKHYAIHFITFFWKLLFALIPPSELLGGYASFVVSIFFIGLLTAIVGDLATHFGCGIYLSDVVTAITWVALGTSLPDTFASKIAAIQDPSADSSIGNITGSNAVNVFLGVGISWTIGAIYHEIHGTTFVVREGDLKFSVFMFSPIAFVVICILILRRYHPKIKAELGGPVFLKVTTSVICVLLWCIFITLCSLRVYCII